MLSIYSLQVLRDLAQMRITLHSPAEEPTPRHTTPASTATISNIPQPAKRSSLRHRTTPRAPRKPRRSSLAPLVGPQERPSHHRRPQLSRHHPRCHIRYRDRSTPRILARHAGMSDAPACSFCQTGASTGRAYIPGTGPEYHCGRKRSCSVCKPPTPPRASTRIV